MTEHILYSFRRCPYAIRARMALFYAGIDCELRELMLKDKPPDMLQHSAKGTVPVLITHTKQVIDESLDVMLWALEQHDPSDWLKNKSQSLRIIHHCDQDFKPLLDKYKYADRHPELSEQEHRSLTIPFIEQLNEQLIKTKFLVSETTQLADIALFPFIRQYAFVNKLWFDQLPYPALQKWLNDLLESNLFRSIMPKFKLFNDGHSHYLLSGKTLC